MKHFLYTLILLSGFASLSSCQKNNYCIEFNGGNLLVLALDENAIRIKYTEGDIKEMPELVYVETNNKVNIKKTTPGNKTIFRSKQMSLTIDHSLQTVSASDNKGNIVFTASAHQLKESQVQGEATKEATLMIESPKDEFLYGLGQFQDGYLNVRGLTRRLTQVNTQISIPFLLSSKGYGLLWNNYGLTDFNPADQKLIMERIQGEGQARRVNVTSTEGGRTEIRRNNNFKASINIPESGKYCLLLDVGQKMARRHNLSIDGKNVIDVRNLWLPPTTSIIIELQAGSHELKAELERGDQPIIYYKKVEDNTVLRSPVAECVDYTIFTGTPDEIIASYRSLTGEAPMLPSWALGYIHCRERFHSQEELLATAHRFREERIPLDLIVQDWQYWGKYGWNAMKFDEEFYPDPAQMVNELHDMNAKLMLSVWSKIDPASEIGKEAQERGLFIPETTWIDFFDKEASDFYWENFSEKLLSLGIDAWWQDATEPENDDLEGRRIIKGTEIGERYRNVYPMMVNKTVYEGLRNDDPERRAMIFTRSGFSGIQKYSAVLWSGDVGNDWQALKYQISAGLNFVSTGVPWWTYDAGGFFRPNDQYTNQDYIERLIRWVQTSTFLPLMRTHGYMSNTEPWNYGPEAQRIITDYIRLRYKLNPYIYSEAALVTLNGSTIMRPLVFDFAKDQEALRQNTSYMFGKSMLINPITEGSITEQLVYLPENNGGWYDWWTGERLKGKQYINAKVDIETIPIYVKAGSIIPTGPDKQYVAEPIDEAIVLNIYPGADASFTLYEDEGTNYNYEKGDYSTIQVTWRESEKSLTISKRKGSFNGMQKERDFTIKLLNKTKTINYTGKEQTIYFSSHYTSQEENIE